MRMHARAIESSIGGSSMQGKGRVALCAFALVVGCGRGRESTAERCAHVREHLIELQLADDPRRAEHESVVRRAMGDGFIESCARTMSDAQRDCVLSAVDSRSALACTKPPTSHARSR